jgi:hypothetical protein
MVMKGRLLKGKQKNKEENKAGIKYSAGRTSSSSSRQDTTVPQSTKYNSKDRPQVINGEVKAELKAATSTTNPLRPPNSLDFDFVIVGVDHKQ